MNPQREFLLERLAHARAALVALIPQAPADRDIYPNWTIKEYLDHLAGWDDAVVEALSAHAKGEPIPQTAARGINAYNAQTVSTRETLGFEHSRREFFASREAVIKALHDLPEEKLNQPLVFPWGETGTVAYFIEIFVDHDEHHTAHLSDWLKNPDAVIAEH
jgi:hypothetical protein